jgi:AcrR family transcriptional regulator
MASAATAPGNSLHPKDWIDAASARLAKHGVEAVRVEALARELRVSKGSFYWHFRDRADLLERVLAGWEAEELRWMEDEHVESMPTARRWARIVEMTADPERVRMRVAVRAWARADEHVAARVAAIEKKNVGLIASVLQEIGFSHADAESWAQIAMLVCLGWLDRSGRGRQATNHGLGDYLSELILAASARGGAGNS